MPTCGVETLLGLALDDLAALCEAAARHRGRVGRGRAADRSPAADRRTAAGGWGYDRAVTFPQRRLRRLRRTPALRRLVAETRLGVDDLIAPLFVREGIDEPQPIASLPGVVQHTRESLRKEVAELGRPRHPRR